jgi:hypothetical protein
VTWRKQKQGAAKRVLKMIKVIKNVKKTGDNAGQKALEASQERKKVDPGKLEGHTLRCSFGNEKVQKASKIFFSSIAFWLSPGRSTH